MSPNHLSQTQEGHEVDLFAGGRALQAILRPYSVRCSGTPLVMNFDVATRRFVLEFQHDPEITSAPTIVFVPFFQYPQTPRVQISDGRFNLSLVTQTLEYYHDASAGQIHTLTLLPGNLSHKSHLSYFVSNQFTRI